MYSIHWPKSSSFRRVAIALAIGVLAPISLSSPARASALICSKLLLEVELNPDPRSIRATIFHTLAQDYPILLSERVSAIILGEYIGKDPLTPHRGVPPGWHPAGHAKTDYNSPVMFIFPETRSYRMEVIQEVPAVALRLRHEKIVNSQVSPEISAAATRIWERILADFSPSNRLASYSEYQIKEDRFQDAANILLTIERAPSLRQEVLSILEAEFASVDSWLPRRFPEFGDSIRTAKGRHRFFNRDSVATEYARIQASEAEFALPTLSSAMKSAEEIVPLDLDYSRITAAFRATPDPAALSTYETTLAFDRDLLLNFQKFSSGTSTLRDQFITYPIWGEVYAAAVKWINPAGEVLTARPKSEFVNAVLHALSLLDAHSRVVMNARRVLSFGEANAIAKIAELERVIAASPDSVGALDPLLVEERHRSLSRMTQLLAEIRSFGSVLAGWSERTADANRRLRTLHAETTAGPMRVKDAEAFRASMKEIRTTLDLDVTFDRHLDPPNDPRAKGWRFW